MYKVDNAIIMAAGTSSRFAPLSFEKPKALIEVRGEVLIERQIKQLRAAGIDEIIVVTGYKSEQFDYLKDKLGVILVHNHEYMTRNNNSSIYAVRDYLKNSYICSADNYFSENPFEEFVDEAYYSAIYSNDYTNEWCIKYDDNDYITDVKIGGTASWYMLGHVFWSEDFSRKFINILENEYDLEETRDLLWEDIYINHISELKMKIRKYEEEIIYEFDTLDELRLFDETYIKDTRSTIIKSICNNLNCTEDKIVNLKAFKDNNNEASGFTFTLNDKSYKYSYKNKELGSV